MTRDAQSALRRTMEKEGKSTRQVAHSLVHDYIDFFITPVIPSGRFCLICNYVSRIIEPLTSRCAKFRFKPLAKEVLIERIEMIGRAEGVVASQGAKEALLETSEGDLRKAITLFQSCARLRSATGQEIEAEDVLEISGKVPSKWLTGLLEVCTTNSFDKLTAYVDELMCEGFAVTQLISQLHDKVVEDESLSDKQKSIICEELAIGESRLLSGANEYLQLLNLAVAYMQTLMNG